jgi:hypothetical protein
LRATGADADRAADQHAGGDEPMLDRALLVVDDLSVPALSVAC